MKESEEITRSCCAIANFWFIFLMIRVILIVETDWFI